MPHRTATTARSTKLVSSRRSRVSVRITKPRSTLRYLDGLPVPEVAHTLGRTLHATEALLMRAKRAFRQAYEGGQDG